MVSRESTFLQKLWRGTTSILGSNDSAWSKNRRVEINSLNSHEIFFAVLLIAPLFISNQEVDAADILFLKIQELEGELATLKK